MQSRICEQIPSYFGAEGVNLWVQQDHLSTSLQSNNIFLPTVTVENIQAIKEKLSSIQYSQKESYASLLLENNGEYIRKLLTISNDMEDLDDKIMLGKISDIFRSILYFNNIRILDFVLEDKNIFISIVGVMEYDPQLKAKGNFREFLTKVACFKEAVPLRNNNIRLAIAKLFNLKYLKDIILRPCIDEIGVPALNNLIGQSTNEICTKIFEDIGYLAQVLHLIDNTIDITQYTTTNNNDSMNSTDTSIGQNSLGTNESEQHHNEQSTSEDSNKTEKSSKEDGIRFFRELFFLARNLTLERRTGLVALMLKSLRFLLLSTIQKVLMDRQSTIIEKQYAAEILSSITMINPGAVRLTIIEGPIPSMPPHAEKIRSTQSLVPGQVNLGINSHNDQCLLYVIIICIINENDAATIEQLSDTFKMLIDCDRLDRKDREKFLVLCYDYYFHWLIIPFMEPNIPYQQISNPDNKEGGIGVKKQQDESCVIASRRFILDILCICVHGHTYRMKYFLLRNNLFTRVNKVFESNHRSLQLGAIRFMRTVLGNKFTTILILITNNDK